MDDGAKSRTEAMQPRETKHKGDSDQEQPPAKSDFGEILSAESMPQASGAAQKQGALNDDGAGTGAGHGNDDDGGKDAAVATSSTATTDDEDRPVEIAPSANADGSGKAGAEEEDEVSGDVPSTANDDDDDVDSVSDDGDETNVTEADGDDDAETDDDDDIDDDVVKNATDAAEANQEVGKKDGESGGDTLDEATENGAVIPEAEIGTSSGVKDEKDSDSKTNTAEDETKATKPYPDVLRGPHKKSNEELNKLRGSHDRDKAPDADVKAGPLPADDEKAENTSAKERTKGSPEIGIEQGEERSPHKNLGPPAPATSKGRQHHSSSPAECSIFSFPCHAKAAFSTHPLTFVLVAATFVLLLIRRIKHRNRNNANARWDGRGEYASIELLEGNFDDEMSFTADDEDPDDIIASWRGDAVNSFVASGVGDDLDDGVGDGELSLSELNG